MPQNDLLEGTQQQKTEQKQEQQQQNANTEQTVSELALQQAQVGLNMLWLIQQAAAVQQQQQQVEDGTGTASSSSSLSDQPNVSFYSALSNVLGLGKVSSSSQICSSPLMIPPTKHQENGIASNEDKRRRDLSIIGRRWEYVSDVLSFAEFEQLRCRHQVSRNRTFAHGIRYSCTQKTQLRSNCPYLLLCLFSDGAGEHSAPGVGTISVYSRNKHTHPVKVIKARQPRRFAKLAKKEQRGDKEEEENGNKKKGAAKEREEIGEGKEEKAEKGTKEEKDVEMGETGEALIEILSKMLAEQQRDGERAKDE